MTIAPEDFKPLVDSKLIRFGGHWADAHIKSAKGSVLFVSYTEFPPRVTTSHIVTGCKRQKDPRLYLGADERRARPVSAHRDTAD